MAKREALEELFARHGFTDFKWIKSKDITVAQWVRLRCLFGCPAYGIKGSCPPNVPSIEQCREIFSEYDEAAIFHFEMAFEDLKERVPWGRYLAVRLRKLERDVFLAGYYKAFLIGFEAWAVRRVLGRPDGLKDKRASRPGADAMGIDVYTTVRSVGYNIQPLKDYHEAMNRFAFLLIE